MKTKPAYFIPPEHIQKGVITNTPEWLREHFRNEGIQEEHQKMKEAIEKLKERLTEDRCPICLHKLTISNHLCEYCHERIIESLDGVVTNSDIEEVFAEWLGEETRSMFRKVRKFFLQFQCKKCKHSQLQHRLSSEKETIKVGECLRCRCKNYGILKIQPIDAKQYHAKEVLK